MKQKKNSSFLRHLISRNIKLLPLFIASFLAGLGAQMALHPGAHLVHQCSPLLFRRVILPVRRALRQAKHVCR